MLATPLHFLLANAEPAESFFRMESAGKGFIHIYCSNVRVEDVLTQCLWSARLIWAACYGILISRYVFQIFGNINIFGNSILAFFFRASRLPNRFLMGTLPSIYGIDLSLFLTFYLFEWVDQLLNKILIIGPTMQASYF
jgi:hypothetical protein